MLSPQFIEEMRNKLLEEKQRLEEELAGIQPHTEMGDASDENADEVELDEVNRDVMATIQGDLEKIDQALAKIDAGTYGTDDEGKEISEERLRVLPWADRAI